ncbi:MAG: hypothetical protein BWK79_01400 [Beggiatoa sp. IS2]|nr:MAG: hypothetical protein BWK79_01400 [Beggiatoa sp. IS2]
MSANFSPLNVLVTGATNQIGYFLIPRLQQAGFTVTAITHRSWVKPPLLRKEGLGMIAWQQIDLESEIISISQPSSLIHCAPLPLLPLLLTRLPVPTLLQRIIAFSSTSRFTKLDSSVAKEREIATRLAEAEANFIALCDQFQIAWTLFRPTLIYGCGRDRNITMMTQWIRRFGFFPILGEGKGLRQPVHADDLAQACIQAYNIPVTYRQSYHLSGGQTLHYRAMVETIFHQLGKKPRIVSLPQGIFEGLIAILAKFPSFNQLSPAMVTRMNQDLCFDHSAATRDFGYQPREFEV